MSKRTSKRIVIKIGPGSLETGYTAAVQIGREGLNPQAETHATLPPAPDLRDLYRRWQQAYRQIGAIYRIKPLAGVTNVSDVAAREACQVLSRQLRDRLHHWLNSDDFRPIREKLLEQLNPQDIARVLLQTQDPLLQRLPWHELHFFQRYPRAEVGICALEYQQVTYPGTRSEKVRILAVMGSATGLDTRVDETLLSSLSDVDIHFLKEPSLEAFNQSLWAEAGWDILFFAGHSRSRENCAQDEMGSGEMSLNATEQLTIPQLKHALRKAIDRGLNTAIFNSCDGLGLAADLADLHIPQVLVMREPVPDQVAHAFLKGFLDAFSSGRPFYLSVREAREKLQGLETRFPCATWLPVIVQNLAETPPTWRSLQGKAEINRSKIHQFADAAIAISPLKPPVKPSVRPTAPQHRFRQGIGVGVAIATILLLGRQLGFLEPLELKAYDLLLRSRPPETIDNRLLIITNTDKDIAAYPNPTGKSSLADTTLLALLDKLTPLQPQLIGLDIYRGDLETDPTLATKLKATDNLIAICKVSDSVTDTPGKPPPPEFEDTARIGASDFIEDQGRDNILRRHLLQLGPTPNSPCQASNTFSTVLASRYLKATKGIVDLPFTRITQTAFGGYHNLDVEGGSQIMLNYRILRNPEQTTCGNVIETPADCITVSEVLAQSADQLRNSVEGRIILIGTTDMDFGAGDRWLTPYTQTPALEDQASGVFLQAQMISQLLSTTLDTPARPIITSWSEWQEMTWITLWALIGGLLGAYANKPLGMRLWLHLGLRLLIAKGVLLLACWLWLTKAGVWIPWVPSALALPATGAIAALTAQSRQTLQNQNQNR